MKPLFNSRTKRNAAFALLLVWLFALASGVANACLTQAREVLGDVSLPAHFVATAKAHAIFAGDVDAISGHDSRMQSLKPQCLKVCVDGSQSPTKQQAGSDLTHPQLAPLPAVAWSTAAPVVSALGLAVFTQPPDTGLPIRVRLSRLAL